MYRGGCNRHPTLQLPAFKAGDALGLESLAVPVRKDLGDEGHRGERPACERDRAVVRWARVCRDVAGTAADSLVAALRGRPGDTLAVLYAGDLARVHAGEVKHLKTESGRKRTGHPHACAQR